MVKLSTERLPPAPVRDAVIGLGSNLGDREGTLSWAVHGLGLYGRLVSVSFVYETPPLGPPQPDYLNAAARLLFEGEPEELLESLLGLERSAGRERRVRWGARTLDLDILWIRGLVLETPKLTIPHPGLSVRPFALVPLLDVAPDATDPRSGTPLAETLRALDTSTVRRVSAERLRALETLDPGP